VPVQLLGHQHQQGQDQGQEKLQSPSQDQDLALCQDQGLDQNLCHPQEDQDLGHLHQGQERGCSAPVNAPALMEVENVTVTVTAR